MIALAVVGLILGVAGVGLVIATGSGYVRPPVDLSFADSDVTSQAAEAAAQGWGGDWEVTYAAGGLTCTRSDVEGDTPGDTAELLDALTEYALSHPDVTVTEADGRARMEVCYEVPIAGPDAR